MDRKPLTHRQRMELSLKTGLALSTVTKWDHGKDVTESTDRTLLRAASELGYLPENEVPADEH